MPTVAIEEKIVMLLEKLEEVCLRQLQHRTELKIAQPKPFLDISGKERRRGSKDARRERGNRRVNFGR